MLIKVTIVTTIHNVKSNHGGGTPGIDNKTMRRDYPQKSYKWVINDIQEAFEKFKPQKVRRKYISKPDKKERRPPRVPAMRDHIAQGCMRIVTGSIMEVQFFEHSCGLRPMHGTVMAPEKLNFITFHTGYYWSVGRDISKCFDRINHTTLLRKLCHVEIKDRWVLQIIKQVLKVGVLDEYKMNKEGTMQGGTISPLLANVHFGVMDEWVTKQWGLKHIECVYIRDPAKREVLKKTSLVSGFLVRYVDDFVIITDNRGHAESWEVSSQIFLKTGMRLVLSKGKTLITDVRRKHACFLGYELRVVKGKDEHSYVTRIRPDRERPCRKVDALTDSTREIPRETSREKLIDGVNRINSQIRGVIQYYQRCTWVSVSMDRYSRKLQLAASRRLKQFKGK